MDDRPRYMISVAADIVGMHPQTLRIYENKGLIRPKRPALLGRDSREGRRPRERGARERQLDRRRRARTARLTRAGGGPRVDR